MSDTGDDLILDLDRCPCGGGTLDKLTQPAVMALLSREDTHGYRLVRALAEMPMFGGQAPDAAGIYRVLRSLEERGLVVSSWGLPESGPARRLYQLTPVGLACLRRWTGTLERYHQAIGGLLEITRAAIPEE